MKIPNNYYFTFWIKNSFLALATGFIIVIFIPPLFVTFPSIGLLGLVIYQIFIYKFFFGSRRGDFEYKYREDIIEKKAREVVLKSFNHIVFFRYILDQLNQISLFRKDLFQKLLNKRNLSSDEFSIFSIYMKLAEAYLKDNSYEKEKFFLEKALEIRPNDLVANYRLAVAFERFGEGDKAVKCYKLASKDPIKVSRQLKSFISQQISRVISSGPRRKPPIPGLRYITW